MLRYSAEAVLESRKQMDATALIHRPVLGRVQLAVMRGFLRFIDVIPAFRRRMLVSMTKRREQAWRLSQIGLKYRLRVLELEKRKPWLSRSRVTIPPKRGMGAKERACQTPEVSRSSL
jgi:hypothetical protein